MPWARAVPEWPLFTPLRPGIAVQRLPAILYALPEFVLDDAQFRQVLDDLRAVRI